MIDQNVMNAVSPNTDHTPPPPDTHHNDIAATAAAVAASVGAHAGNLAPVDDAATSAAMDAVVASTAAVEEEDKVDDPSQHLAPAAAVSVTDGVPTTSEDINALYDKAYRSMNKGIYLLCQWKQSWDSAIAAAVAAAD